MRGDQLRAGRGHEVLLNLLTLTSAQQTVVHKHTGQTVADSALHECGRNSGVHAAGQTANSAAFGADLGPDVIDKLLCDIRRSPSLLQTCYLGEEAGEHFLAMRGVHNLRMVLHASHLFGHAFHRSDRGTGRGSGHGKASGASATASPCDIHTLWLAPSVVQHATGVSDFGTAVFTVTGLRNAAAQGVVHGLEAVADAENGNAKFQQFRLELRGAIGVHGGRAAGQNQGGRVLGLDFFNGGRVWDYLGVHRRLAYATSNKLCVLGAKVHHEDWARSCCRLSHTGSLTHPRPAAVNIAARGPHAQRGGDSDAGTSDNIA